MLFLPAGFRLASKKSVRRRHAQSLRPKLPCRDNVWDIGRNLVRRKRANASLTIDQPAAKKLNCLPAYPGLLLKLEIPRRAGSHPQVIFVLGYDANERPAALADFQFGQLPACSRELIETST